MKNQTARSRLRDLLTERFVPLLFTAGFVGPKKISGNGLLHEYVRSVGQEIHHLTIVFEKYQRPRFYVDLAVEPPGGYKPLIANGGEVVLGLLKPKPGPSTRHWFRADPTWWKRLLIPRTPTLEHEAVDECVRLWPEVETWWATRSPSEHIQVLPTKFPGTRT